MRLASIQAERQENTRCIKFRTESSKTNINVPGLVPLPVVQFNVLGPYQWLLDPAAPQIPPPQLNTSLPRLNTSLPWLNTSLPWFRAIPQ